VAREKLGAAIAGSWRKGAAGLGSDRGGHREGARGEGARLEELQGVRAEQQARSELESGVGADAGAGRDQPWGLVQALSDLGQARGTARRRDG
jgi:hypothetical protein